VGRAFSSLPTSKSTSTPRCQRAEEDCQDKACWSGSECAGVGVSALGGSEFAGVGVNVWSLRRWRLSRTLLGSGEGVCATSASTRCDLADVLRSKRTASEVTASRAHQRANAPPPPHLNVYSNKQLRMHTNEQQEDAQQQLNAPTSKISLPPPRLKGN
jgi:hypothetical protein